MIERSILPIDKTLRGTYPLNQSGLGSNDNKGVTTNIIKQKPHDYIKFNVIIRTCFLRFHSSAGNAVSIFQALPTDLKMFW